MTIPTPSEQLPSAVVSDAVIARQVAVDIATADLEVEAAAKDDPLDEVTMLRVQRDQLIARVLTLRAELAPMQLVIQMLTALAWRNVGREVIVTDEEIDAAFARPIEFHRTGSGEVPGWIADAMPGATKDLSHVIKPREGS